MEHLFNSVVAVYRLESSAVDGMLSYTWLDSGVRIKCRLDIGFLRPGKDQPMAVEAGKAPDRVGVLYCLPDQDIRAGDRVVALEPAAVPGTFEVRVIPDRAQGFATAHHIEVQIVEVSQALAGVFPGSE
jgi:hypothetical protein